MLFTLTWRYLRTRAWSLVAIALLQIASTAASLYLPDLNAQIIDQGVAVGDTGFIWRTGAVMLGVSVVQAAATVWVTYLGAQLSMALGAWLRDRVYHQAQGFAAQEVHRFGAPSLVTRATNDVQQIQFVTLMLVTVMVAAPITGVGGVVMAVRQDRHLSLLLLVAVPLLAVVVGLIMGRLVPLFGTQQKRIDAMNTVLREELSGVRVIRAFVRQRAIAARYREANDGLRAVALGIGNMFALMMPAIQSIVSLSTVAVVWFGGILIDRGDMQVGALFAYINYLALIFMSVMMAAMMFVMIPRAGVSAGRIHEVLSTRASVRSPERPRPLPPSPVGFALDSVTMRYPGAEAPVIEDVSLALAPGTTTAIIGPTGAGKSTLVNLLARLMDPSGGRVLAGDVPIGQVDLEALRQRVAVVPQHAYLFSGTVATTVAGSDHPGAEERERVLRALAGAQAREFVDALSEGIDAPVEAGGLNFSGGQRQRLTIARALYRRADLYVFDDSFSALDYATDARLRLGLRHYIGGAAVLIVAQRVATIRHADQIAVLDEGRIVGLGSHARLMHDCPAYQQIVASQLTAEEAA